MHFCVLVPNGDILQNNKDLDINKVQIQNTSIRSFPCFACYIHLDFFGSAHVSKLGKLLTYFLLKPLCHINNVCSKKLEAMKILWLRLFIVFFSLKCCDYQAFFLLICIIQCLNDNHSFNRKHLNCFLVWLIEIICHCIIIKITFTF